MRKCFKYHNNNNKGKSSNPLLATNSSLSVPSTHNRTSCICVHSKHNLYNLHNPSTSNLRIAHHTTFCGTLSKAFSLSQQMKITMVVPDTLLTNNILLCSCHLLCDLINLPFIVISSQYIAYSPWVNTSYTVV